MVVFFGLSRNCCHSSNAALIDKTLLMPDKLLIPLSGEELLREKRVALLCKADLLGEDGHCGLV